MLSTQANQALPLFPLLNLLSFHCKEHFDPSFNWLPPSGTDHIHKYQPLQLLKPLTLNTDVFSFDLISPFLFLNKRFIFVMLWSKLYSDCYFPGLILFTRFRLPYHSTPHCWPTLHSPWRTGLPLRTWTCLRLLRQLSDLHSLLCLWQLNLWCWTLADDITSLPCRLLWQPGWVGKINLLKSFFTNWETAMLSGVVQRNVKHFPFLQIHFATGVVTSPNYPGNYPNNLEKTETIQVEEGLIISLQFTAFDIEPDSTCHFDHLTITDGDGTTLMEKSCGNPIPAAIRSTSNIVKLVFITDVWGTMTGWSVRWSAVTPGECQQHVWIIFIRYVKTYG